MSDLFNIQGKLRDKVYRESWVASVVKRMIPLQIRVMRKERDWSQGDLAKESKLTQGAISRAEDPDYGNLSINTLVRIAAGFDCAFVGRFVSFSELGRWYTEIQDESSLRVPSFGSDFGFVDRKGIQSSAALVTCEAAQTMATDSIPTDSIAPQGARVIPFPATSSQAGRQQISQISIASDADIPHIAHAAM